MLGYFPFAANLEKENADEGNLCELSNGYFILGVEKSDGGRDGGRSPDLGLNILNYTISFKASQGAKGRGGGIMVSGLKTGNTRSKDRKIMLVLCYCERFEDEVTTEDGKEGERPVKGRELFLPVIDQHS
jgi:hypothetical protein